MKRAVLYAAAGILCVIYGVIIAGVGSGTHFYGVWYMAAAAFFILAVCAGLKLWSRLHRYFKRAFLVVLCVCLVFFCAVEGLIFTGFSADGEGDPDYIIVLGAQMKDDGPSVVLKSRLDTAEKYLKENPDVICIVSGGQGYNEPCSEAEGMWRYLTDKGIDSSRIIKEDRSESTGENIKNSLELIDDRNAKIGILTNNFHVYRALKTAERLGIDRPSGIAAPSVPLYLPNNMLREFFALINDTLRN